MLIVVSDLHLVDGTCGRSVSPAAYQLFAERIKELAISASWRGEQTYRPIEQIDILLMGDILDPLHSTLWLEGSPGQADYIRPWSDQRDPLFAEKLQRITSGILNNNQESIQTLRNLSDGKLVRLLPADRRGHIAYDTRERVPVEVRIHYMVGNHDWYYHLSGEPFEKIRQQVTSALGLANPPGAYPHQSGESPILTDLLLRHGVHAQHGDLFDPFNYDAEQGRDFSTIGDAFTVEVVNRFPYEVNRLMGAELPPALLDNLCEMVNVRPTLVTPLWISGQLRQNNIPEKQQKKIKSIWDQLGQEFLNLDLVRAEDKRFKFDVVDALQILLSLTRSTTFKTIDDIVVWIRENIGSGEVNYARHVFKESAFLNRTAQFFVYGHIHHHEIVPLDTYPATQRSHTNQVYFNSGTWHTYYDLAIFKPSEEKFIPYQVLSYVSFFRDDQHGGRRYETWSGAFSE